MLSRVHVPRTARPGEVIEIRIFIQHPMETGFRLDDVGQRIPRNVVNRLVCAFNGETVFNASLGSGIAANPYLQFFAMVDASGEFVFEWEDDNGKRGSARAAITVSA